MKFLHISDLHLHRSQDDNQPVKEMFEYIKANYPDHYLIITGDIVDDGHPRQYARAAELLMEFEGRVFICPGNHDYGAGGAFFSKERAMRFDRSLSEPLDQGGSFTGDATPVVNVVRDGGQAVMLIALDTNLETWIPLDMACGEVGEYQLGVLDAILGNPSTAGMPKILFFHHHPFMHFNPIMMLKDACELARVVNERVDVILFGHKHVSKYWSNQFGAEHVLASGKSPGAEGMAREVIIDAGGITVNDVKVMI